MLLQEYLHILVYKKDDPCESSFFLAPQVGLEPTTTRLTAECSAIELLRNIGCGEDFSSPLPFLESGDVLLSRAVSSQVPSAC